MGLNNIAAKWKEKVPISWQILRKKPENGVPVSDIANQIGMENSMISTILKNREIIKKASSAREAIVITKWGSQTIEEMEKLLIIWINDSMLADKSVSQCMICEKQGGCTTTLY